MGLKKSYKKLIKNKLLINLLKVSLFGLRCPTMVSWRLTNRCNQRCRHCYLWERDVVELETSKIFTIIDKLWLYGIKFITFNGGEPLLRNDIGRIVNYAFKKGMYIRLNTNGRLLKDNIDCLDDIDEIHLSLYGQREVDNALRGKGSFESTVEAIEIAKKKKVPVFLTAVLSKENLSCVDFLLSFAKKHKLKLDFQPAFLYYLGTDKFNLSSPVTKEYKEVLLGLINNKRKGNKHIINSVSALNHLYHFPNEKSIRCLAGNFMFRIESDGRVSPCGWGLVKERQGESEIDNFLSNPQREITSCNSCWCCQAVEMNLILALRFEPIINALANII